MKKIKVVEKDKITDNSQVYTKRFHFLMRLIRINKMLRSAKIIPAGK